MKKIELVSPNATCRIHGCIDIGDLPNKPKNSPLAYCMRCGMRTQYGNKKWALFTTPIQPEESLIDKIIIGIKDLFC